MRNVLLLLFFLISLSNAQNFKLCDVTKAESPLISIDQNYLLKTLYGPFVETHGQSDKKFIPTNIHPFIYAAHKAYAEHRPLTISPDGVWLLISQGLTTHLYSKEGDQAVTLIIEGNEKTDLSNEEWLKHLDKFQQTLKSSTAETIQAFHSPDFSTTDMNIKNAFKISSLSNKSEQFQFGLFSLCGIPEITLEGTTNDWLKIADKLESLKQFGMEEWADHLKPIINEIILASKGQVNKKFWNSFYKFNNECGDGSVSGWILNFFPYNAKGQLRPLIQIDSDDLLIHMPDSDPNVSFPSGRVYLPFSRNTSGKAIEMRFEAGFMGVSQHPETMSLKAEINWAVIKRPVSGQISIWQQNVVREGAVSKMKLSAAFSATYIDIGNFIDEEDSGLNQLKLLEFAIVKRPVKGAFLKDLTELPNFKELELHDWNIETENLPYISRLKNKSFIFSKPVNPEFFSHLPNTSKTLVFKDTKVKAEYFENIKVDSLENINFNNCKFESGVMTAIGKLHKTLKSVKIYKSPDLSLEQIEMLNALNKLETLSITSSKLKELPTLKLPSLKSLNLSSNALSSIEKIKSLESLEYLNLAKNNISGKKNFNHLTKLEQLVLHHNEITQLDIDLEHLANLDVSSNRLESLPDIKKNRLTSLIVEKNQIGKASLPSSLHETLEHLSLEMVHLDRESAASIGSMKNLRFLSLKNCDLTNADVGQLSNLKHLNTLKLWTNRDLTDQCKDKIITLFKRGANISIFDCGFSSMAMDEFAKLRENQKVN